MLTGFLVYDSYKETNSEGELYKSLNVYGCDFDIYYGYYEDCDRQNPFVDPMPIYPDFIKNPQYTKNGLPFVTKMQGACSYYKGKDTKEKDCAECRHYLHGAELLGVCTCYERELKSEGFSDSKHTQEETK
ncbi:MAG: hypothetical protein J6C03_05940 [Clostridia bacterium]|nr:hypothetical protein [Clostridia bacterium]